MCEIHTNDSFTIVKPPYGYTKFIGVTHLSIFLSPDQNKPEDYDFFIVGTGGSAPDRLRINSQYIVNKNNNTTYRCATVEIPDILQPILNHSKCIGKTDCNSPDKQELPVFGYICLRKENDPDDANSVIFRTLVYFPLDELSQTTPSAFRPSIRGKAMGSFVEAEVVNTLIEVLKKESPVTHNIRIAPSQNNVSDERIAQLEKVFGQPIQTIRKSYAAEYWIGMHRLRFQLVSGKILHQKTHYDKLTKKT
jgi:hypothetical protein